MSIAPRTGKAHHMRATGHVGVAEPAAKGAARRAKARARGRSSDWGRRAADAGICFSPDQEAVGAWAGKARNFWYGKTVKMVYFATLHEKTFS
ncbi:hypothetical protein Ssi03_68250 [Sphaerisporangium siamense]|nr:hypothetical protein Ssi03_68250 [Sphaerisporangium siamense]